MDLPETPADPLRPLAGQVALVTGGGGGIGRGIALALAGAGAHVVIADVVPERCEEAAARVRELGRRALAQPTDVCDTAQIEAARAAPGYAVYAACKAGMNNFTRTMARTGRSRHPRKRHRARFHRDARHARQCLRPGRREQMAPAQRRAAIRHRTPHFTAPRRADRGMRPRRAVPRLPCQQLRDRRDPAGRWRIVGFQRLGAITPNRRLGARRTLRTFRCCNSTCPCPSTGTFLENVGGQRRMRDDAGGAQGRRGGRTRGAICRDGAGCCGDVDRGAGSRGMVR